MTLKFMHLQTSNREVTTESIKYWYIKGGGVPKLGKCPSCPHLKTYPLPLFWDSKNRIFLQNYVIHCNIKEKLKEKLDSQIKSQKLIPPSPISEHNLLYESYTLPFLYLLLWAYLNTRYIYLYVSIQYIYYIEIRTCIGDVYICNP